MYQQSLDDIDQMEREFHSARHMDNELAEWARTWGRVLIDELRSLRLEVHALTAAASTLSEDLQNTETRSSASGHVDSRDLVRGD